MENLDKNTEQENKEEKEEFYEGLSPDEETNSFENKIPAQYKALQDAAKTGIQYIDEIAEESES